MTHVLSSAARLDDASTTLADIYGPRTAALLHDLLGFADDASRLVTLGRARFDTEPMLRHAADGLIAKIGEVVVHLPSIFTDDYPDAHWHRLAELRRIAADDNGLRVNYESVWDTIAEAIPRDVAYIRAVVSAFAN